MLSHLTLYDFYMTG